MSFRLLARWLVPALVLGAGASACSEWAFSSLYGKKCGDEYIATGEECRTEECGDGIATPGEECDDANESDEDGCLSDCTEARCGDGRLRSSVEDCDDGNVMSGDGCDERCRLEDRCGDGQLTGAELCDDGNVEAGDGCSPLCFFEPDPVLCGNGELDENEVCDDGNESADDGCSPACAWTSCGDGVQRRGVEECEDANEQNGDGCTRSCIACGGEDEHHRLSNDHCYKIHEERVPYAEAFAVCVAEGSYLWTPTSGWETRETVRNLAELSQELWIGLPVVEGEHRWITEDSSNYRAWTDGQPTARECTVEVRLDDDDANFISRNCTANRAFICEKEPARIDPVSHVAYRRFFTPSTFQEAGQYCVAQGGALLTLETTEEQQFVRDDLRSDTWLGASRSLSGDFEWLSGERVSPVFLEGLDVSGTGDCLRYVNGTLQVSSCDETSWVICEYP